MTKIKSVHKNLVPALLELKNGCRVIENKGKIGKGIQFKSNSVCLFCLFFFFFFPPSSGHVGRFDYFQMQGVSLIKLFFLE